MKSRDWVLGLLAFAGTLFLLAPSAGAYLDPSAMTYVIQAVAGVAIAGGAAIVIYWKKLKLFFKKGKKNSRKRKLDDQITKE